MAPLGVAWLWTLLAGSSAMRRSADLALEASEGLRQQGATAAKQIQEHIKNMKVNEKHHVCVTGNIAPSFVDGFLLGDTGVKREEKMLESALSPKRNCPVDEAEVGNVVLTIASELEDACVPRWKTHTLTCDVLIHAHSGEDCSQLFKFRLLHEQCNAQLIVIHDNEKMAQCYSGKMASWQQQNQQAWCNEEEEKIEWIRVPEGNNDKGQQVADAMKSALDKNSGDIKNMLEKVVGLDKTASVKQALEEAFRIKMQEQRVRNIQFEIAKALQQKGQNGLLEVSQATRRMKKKFTVDPNEKEDDSDDYKYAVVVDLGSGTLRAGFADEDEPRLIMPNMIGIPKHDTVIEGVDNKPHYVGQEAYNLRGVLELKYPVEHGIVKQWDVLEKIWTSVWEDHLMISPENRRVMLSEPPLNPFNVRETLAENLFVKHKVAGVYINNAAVLSVYAAGVSTGLSVSTGDGTTFVVPVYEGYGLMHVQQRLDIGGVQITNWLKVLLSERGQFRGTDTESTAGREILKTIKETKCKVAFNSAKAEDFEYDDFEEAMKPYKAGGGEEEDYTLPDGKIIQLGSEMIRCGEVMFNPGPKTINYEIAEYENLPGLIVGVIEQCAIDLRKDLYNNIVVGGGNSMFPNFIERLSKEVQKKRPTREAVKVRAPEDRDQSTWIGGSILSALDSFKYMWFTKQDYENNGGTSGEQGLQMKCPSQR